MFGLSLLVITNCVGKVQDLRYRDLTGQYVDNGGGPEGSVSKFAEHVRNLLAIGHRERKLDT